VPLGNRLLFSFAPSSNPTIHLVLAGGLNFGLPSRRILKLVSRRAPISFHGTSSSFAYLPPHPLRTMFSDFWTWKNTRMTSLLLFLSPSDGPSCASVLYLSSVPSFFKSLNMPAAVLPHVTVRFHFRKEMPPWRGLTFRRSYEVYTFAKILCSQEFICCSSYWLRGRSKDQQIGCM